MKRLFNWFKYKVKSLRKELEYRKKLKQLRKRDPFRYKNF